jgi:hypothetical protein
VKPLAIRAAALFAVRHNQTPPAVVCVPCGGSHGVDYWPPLKSMHSRSVLTPYEVDLAARLAAAVRAGAVPLTRLEVVRGFDSFLERFAEARP